MQKENIQNERLIEEQFYDILQITLLVPWGVERDAVLNYC